MAIYPVEKRSATSYVLFDGSDLLCAGNRVRLSDMGRVACSGSDPNREGTVMRLARDGRHVWVKWKGRKSPALCLDAHLRRIGFDRQPVHVVIERSRSAPSDHRHHRLQQIPPLALPEVH